MQVFKVFLILRILRVALGYGLDNRGSRVQFLAWARNFSLHHRIQNGSGAHPASYPMGTRGSFPGDKAIPPLPQYAFMALCSVKAKG
jgi:hypothetical protein